MENQNPIQYRKTHLLLIILLWIYTGFHSSILLFTIISVAYHGAIKNGAGIAALFIFCFLVISFLLTSILVTRNYCRNVCDYKKALIPSIICELIIFVIFLFLLLALLNFIKYASDIVFIVVPIIIFLIESTPNIILYILICKISGKKRTLNLDNNNTITPLVDQ